MFKQIQLIILLILSISIIFAGTHPAEQVLSGNFSGNFNFLDGNVGIGTTKSLYNLDVNGTMRLYHTSPVLEFFDNDASTDSAIGSFIRWNREGNSELAWIGYGSSSNSDFQIRTKISDGNMIFGTNNEERMRISSTGNVGIGVTDPDQILEVSQTNDPTAGTTYLKISNPSSGSWSYGEAATGILFEKQGWPTGYIESTHLRDDNFADHTNEDAGLAFGTRHVHSEDMSTKMVITNSGRVGIGTTTPNSQLEVITVDDTINGALGNIQNSLIINTPGVNVNSGGSISLGNLLGGYGMPTATLKAGASNGNAGYLDLMTSSSPGSLPFTKMRILHNGRVGIGTTQPSQLLDVAGNIQINSNNLYVDTGLRGIRPISGQYGTIQTTGSGYNGWEGYSIDGNYVFMSRDSGSVGIYNDVNNRWIMYMVNGDYLRFFEPDSTNVAMHIEPDGDLNMNSHRIEGLATPNSDDDAATKAYVDANAGGPTWAGYISRNGDWGGAAGGNYLCYNSYSASHICTYEEVIRLGSDLPDGTYWLVDGSDFIRDNGAIYEVVKGGQLMKFKGSSTITCNGWRTSGSSSDYGAPYYYKSGTGGSPSISNGCSGVNRIPCCY